MNAPIASKRLLPAAAELVERVPFYPDETTFNYVNRIACLTAAINRKQVVAMLFGSPTIHTEHPLHCGFGHLAALHTDADGAMPTDLPQRLGMLALYAPFVDAERFRRALDLIHGTQFNRASKILGRRSFGVFRDSPAFCPECLKEDVSSGRTAYYRRVHQISAVLCCPNHGIPLVTTCLSCGSGPSHEQRPMSNCRHCGASLEHDESRGETTNSHAQPYWRLAKFVQAAMNGTLPNVDAAVRIAVYRNRAALRVTNRGRSLEDNLARTVTNTFGRQFLAMLGLQTDAAPTLAWPCLLISGRHFVSEPVANCLILATLFDSVDDYANEVENVQLCGKSYRIRRTPLYFHAEITTAILKDILRGMTVEEIALKHSINPRNISRWIHAVPGLSARQGESEYRLAIRAYKKAVLSYIDKYPGKSRSRIVAHNKSEIFHIRFADPMWLDQHLPA